MRRLAFSILILAPLVVLGAIACDQGTPTEPGVNAGEQLHDELQPAYKAGVNPLVGSWVATSAVLGDDELLAGYDMLYIMVFRSDGTHAVSVSNDVDGLICGSQTDCEWDGQYAYTRTTVTTVEPNHPDPDEAGEDTALYVVHAGRLIFMDFVGEGVGVRLTYKRAGLGL